MAETTGIAWCDSTMNPWIGCSKIGPGCDHCYAELMDSRKRWDGGKTHWGPGVPRYRTSASNWKQPLTWNAKQTSMLAGDPDTPPWRVFCASLADVFDNEVPQGWRNDLWHLIYDTPNLSWLLVTKRIGKVISSVPGWWTTAGFPPNVRLLITVCNQEEADRDIPKLLALPCKNGISYEPALGPVDFLFWLYPKYQGSLRAIEWIIIGGESGPKARPFDLAWARSTIAECKAAGVPCFVKQLGARCQDQAVMSIFDVVDVRDIQLNLQHRAGADPAEWPEDLRVQQFPT